MTCARTVTRAPRSSPCQLEDLALYLASYLGGEALAAARSHAQGMQSLLYANEVVRSAQPYAR